MRIEGEGVIQQTGHLMEQNFQYHDAYYSFPKQKFVKTKTY
jgi:hypothetical protein